MRPQEVSANGVHHEIDVVPLRVQRQRLSLKSRLQVGGTRVVFRPKQLGQCMAPVGDAFRPQSAQFQNRAFVHGDD